MSLIYGIFDFRKNKNVSDVLISMNRACLPQHSDSTADFVHEHIGLGNILRYNTPESVFEKMPLTVGEITITAFARIDNRDQLFSLLAIPTALQKEMPDSVLILKAYQKWKKECVNYLEGDWAFAIWDNSEHELFIALDQYGNTGLYYYQSSDFFAFSSSIKGLFAIKEIPLKLNEKFVVCKLNSADPENGTTGYLNIYHLPAAHTISVKQDRFLIKRYWFMENVIPLHLKSTDDYIQGFLELYKNAVHVRLRSYGKVGSTLSGGLDSGSVSALAALELKEQHKELDTYTSVPLYDTSNLVGPRRFGDETFFAEATSKFSGNMMMHYIKGERISALEGVKKNIDIHDAPSHASGNSFWLLEMMQTAKENGVSTLLTGQCGNASVSWTGLPLPATVANFLYKYKNDSLTLAKLVRHLIKHVLPKSINNTLVKKSVLGDLSSFSAINLNFATSMLHSGQMKMGDIVPDFTPSKNATEQRLRILKPQSNNIGLLWQESSYAYGLNILDPTKDKKLIEYCLGIPDELFRNKDHDRLIIRKAMENILPPVVQWNKKRGLQAADIQYRVQNCYAEIAQLLSDFEQSAFVSTYLDVKRMKANLEVVKSGIHSSNNMPCQAILLRGISVGLFLQRFE